MAFTEDRSVFFNTSEFADVGLYNGVTSVNGIFDHEYQEVFQGSDIGVNTTRPVFIYDNDDITSPVVGTAFVVRTVSYIVREIEVDRDIGKLILEPV